MNKRVLVAHPTSSLCRFLVSCLRAHLRRPVDGVHSALELSAAIETGQYDVVIVGRGLAAQAVRGLESAARGPCTVVVVGETADDTFDLKGASTLPRPRSGTEFDGEAFALAVSKLADAGRSASASACEPRVRQAVVLIAASTGGTEAVGDVLETLPAACAPVVIVQHMPAYTEELVAEQWDARTAARVKLADAPESLECGVVYVARSNAHIVVEQRGAALVIRTDRRVQTGGHCPSADLLFESAAELEDDALGIVLTGMGDDGAQGLLAMRTAGATTWAEHRTTCKVHGMPRAAVALGGVSEELPRHELAERLAEWAGSRSDSPRP